MPPKKSKKGNDKKVPKEAERVVFTGAPYLGKEKHRLMVKFEPQEFVVFGWSNQGVAAARQSGKIYLSIEWKNDEKTKEPVETCNSNFVSGVKNLIQQIHGFSKDSLLSFIDQQHRASGLPAPPSVNFPAEAIPMLKTMGTLSSFAVFPDLEKTIVREYRKKSLKINNRESIHSMVKTTGNSDFSITLNFNTAEYRYNKALNTVTFALYNNVLDILWFDVGQNVKLRRMQDDSFKGFSTTTHHDLYLELFKKSAELAKEREKEGAKMEAMSDDVEEEVGKEQEKEAE